MGHIKKDCYTLENKENLAITNQKEKQPETSDEASIGKDYYNDEGLLVISYSDSKFDDD